MSGTTNLIGKGISALGFERAGEKLQNFDTGDIARGVNGAVDINKSVFGSLKDTFLSTDENTKQVKKAVEDGTKKTVDAIHSLGEQLQVGVMARMELVSTGILLQLNLVHLPTTPLQRI
ncbi:Uncharacterised protein [Escherichia coli]|nr:Uncharacterised protein [Escherichia coli]